MLNERKKCFVFCNKLLYCANWWGDGHYSNFPSLIPDGNPGLTHTHTHARVIAVVNYIDIHLMFWRNTSHLWFDWPGSSDHCVHQRGLAGYLLGSVSALFLSLFQSSASGWEQMKYGQCCPKIGLQADASTCALPLWCQGCKSWLFYSNF